MKTFLIKTMSVQDYLDTLPDDTKEIVLCNRGLTELPDLERFKELKVLYCRNNELTNLPVLPSL